MTVKDNKDGYCNHQDYATFKHNIANLPRNFDIMTPIIGPKIPLLLQKMVIGQKAAQSIIIV